MKLTITDEMIEEVSILSKLELDQDERQQAKQDMEQMLQYVDLLSELDTEGVEPAVHIFPIQNVFRDDLVTGLDQHEAMLRNAPQVRDNQYVTKDSLYDATNDHSH